MYRSLLLPLLPVLLVTPVVGQDLLTPGGNPNQPARADRAYLEQLDPGQRIPYLYEGEIEDVGPQFLLLPGEERHRWFQTLLDSQWFYNSNPTLADSENRVGTDVWITTLEARATTPAYEALGGVIELSGGVWAQTYLYGTLAGRDEQVGGIDMDENNFTGLTVFTELDYERGPWIAGLGLRWTRLSNTGGDDGFYREWVPSWEIGYRLPIGQANLLAFRYDGAWHDTENDTFNLFRDDLNDRWAHTFSLVWTRLLAPGWFLQPYGAALYESYTNEDGREDWTLIGGAALLYQFNEYASVRIFASYQKRNSNLDAITDYEQLNAGLGGTVSFRF